MLPRLIPIRRHDSMKYVSHSFLDSQLPPLARTRVQYLTSTSLSPDTAAAARMRHLHMATSSSDGVAPCGTCAWPGGAHGYLV